MCATPSSQHQVCGPPKPALAQCVPDTLASTLVESVIGICFLDFAGCMLLAADYSQVELRILAHLSGDRRLQALLCTAGPAGDVFCAIAAAWLRGNTCKLLPDAARHLSGHCERTNLCVSWGMSMQHGWLKRPS